MHYQARFVLGRVDFPKLFNADAVMLWISILVQIEFLDQAFTQMTTAAFCKNRIFGMQFITRGKVMRRFSIFTNAHVTGLDAFHGTIFMIEDFSRSKARED